MDFSLTTLFVVPSGTLASSGSTDALTPDQLGLFRPDYSIATAGNIAAAKYFYIAQGRRDVGLAGTGQASKRSDKIAAANVVEWYKTVAEDTAQVQISTIGTFNVQCGEDLSVTIRVHSRLIDITHFNGLTRSVTAKGPCCNCGVSPCTNLTATEIQNLVDDLVRKLQADAMLSKYLTFQRLNSGATSAIAISGTPPVKLQAPTDIATLVPENDRVWFRAFAYTAPPTLSDSYIMDVCEGITAVPVTTQRATYPSGTSDEVKELERQYFSYQQSHFKSLYRNPAWNGAFSSQVVDGTYYTIYYLKCRELDQQHTWNDFVTQDFTVIVAFPAGQETAFETALTAALGAPKNQSGVDVVTTTTTTTSSTTTTTTTVLIP